MYARALLAATACLGMLAAQAHAANTQAFDVSVDAQHRLHVKMTRGTDDGAVPSPAARDEFHLPAGLRLNVGVVPFCSPPRVANFVPASCRRARVGGGTVRFSGITVGQQNAPGKIEIFNARPRGRMPRQYAFVSITEPAQQAWWFEGRTVPAAPPYGAVLVFDEVRLPLFGWPITLIEMDVALGRTTRRGSYLVAPPSCPSSGQWPFKLRSTFSDRPDRAGGPALVSTDAIPCASAASSTRGTGRSRGRRSVR